MPSIQQKNSLANVTQEFDALRFSEQGLPVDTGVIIQRPRGPVDKIIVRIESGVARRMGSIRHKRRLSRNTTRTSCVLCPRSCRKAALVQAASDQHHRHSNSSAGAANCEVTKTRSSRMTINVTSLSVREWCILATASYLALVSGLFYLAGLKGKSASPTNETVESANTALLFDPPLDRFAEDILAFGREDKDHPPPEGGSVFVGSSTFTHAASMLKDYFADFRPIIRAFGGSTIPEINHYLEQTVLEVQTCQNRLLRRHERRRRRSFRRASLRRLQVLHRASTRATTAHRNHLRFDEHGSVACAISKRV